MLAFLTATLMSAGGVYVRAVSTEGLTSPFERAGLVVGEQQGRLRILLIVSKNTAETGLLKGDRITAVNGTAVSEDPSAYDDISSRLDGKAGSSLSITTRSQDGVSRAHILTRGQQHMDAAYAEAGLTRGMMRAADFADVLTTILLLSASALLFQRRPHDPVAALLSLGLLFALTGSGSAEYLIEKIGGDPYFVVILTLGWMGLLLAILTFPNGRFEPRWTFLLALLLPIGAVVELIDEKAGTLSDMVFMVAGVAAIYVRYRRSPPGDRRQQIRWALLGFAAGAFFIIVDQALLFLFDNAQSMTVVLWSELLHYLAYALAFACIPLGLLISLLRYRLYDADAATSRSAAFALLTLFLSALFAGSMNGVEALIQASFGRDAGAEAAAVAAALTAVMVSPAQRRVHRWAEARFQKALTRLQHGLPGLLADMRETMGIEDMLSEVMQQISAGVRANCAAVLLPSGEGWLILATQNVTAEDVRNWSHDARLETERKTLDCRRDDSLFPVRICLPPARSQTGDPVGWILLGPRPDGSFYGKDELEALAEVADPVARAVQIVLLREAQRREARAWRHEIEERLQGLERPS